MKKVLLSTVAALTLVGVANADPVTDIVEDNVFICAGHSNPDGCERALETIAGNAFRAGEDAGSTSDLGYTITQDNIDAAASAGFDNINELIVAATNPKIIEVPGETITVTIPGETITVEVTDQDALDAAYDKGYNRGTQDGYGNGYFQGEEVGTAAGYMTGVAQASGSAYSTGHDEGYAAGVAASADIISQAESDVAAAEAAAEVAGEAAVAALDLDAVAHEARKEVLDVIADTISEHNPKDAKRFRSDPTGLIDGVYNYLWQLRGELGLSGKP